MAWRNPSRYRVAEIVSFRLLNSLTQQLEPLEPLRTGEVSMYHCGPTVYSSPHIGNFRSFLFTISNIYRNQSGYHYPPFISIR